MGVVVAATGYGLVAQGQRKRRMPTVVIICSADLLARMDLPSKQILDIVHGVHPIQAGGDDRRSVEREEADPQQHDPNSHEWRTVTKDRLHLAVVIVSECRKKGGGCDRKIEESKRR